MRKHDLTNEDLLEILHRDSAPENWTTSHNDIVCLIRRLATNALDARNDQPPLVDNQYDAASEGHKAEDILRITAHDLTALQSAFKAAELKLNDIREHDKNCEVTTGAPKLPARPWHLETAACGCAFICTEDRTKIGELYDYETPGFAEWIIGAVNKNG